MLQWLSRNADNFVTKLIVTMLQWLSEGYCVICLLISVQRLTFGRSFSVTVYIDLLLLV